MSNRDPFPMQSAEAKTMEESVRSNATTTGSTWSAMTTHTAVASSSSSQPYTVDETVDNDEETDGGSLMMRATTATATATATNDIYAESTKLNPDRDDIFLDRPVWESRAKGWQRVTVRLQRALEAGVHRLYGNQLPLSEFVRTLALATTLFFMIGGYWLLRSLKDPVMTALCGVETIPMAKMLSVVVVLIVVSVYNALLDTEIPKHKLFYIFGMFYFGLFMIIAVLLMDPVLGLANGQASPWRIMGWVSYCAIESFGSVMVSLFWSFANSNISLETAKASYGVMVATAQVGSILGPTFVSFAAPKYGSAKCYMAGALCMLLLQGTMYCYIAIYGTQTTTTTTNTTTTTTKKKEKAGVLEGLELFAKHNYVKGIFAISCLFMVGVTIVDYTMKVLAHQYFASEHPCEETMNCYNAATGAHGMSPDATTAFTAFMGFFGQATNVLSLLLSLFGTSAVIRYLGLRLTLLLFPSLILVVVIIVRFNPTLYTTFGAMMALKACSYALNNPTKEILYQPTSPAVRYKAKSWIDIFGARGSKALGSVVTYAFSDSAANLVANGSLVGMGVATFLIWNARFMGKKFDEYTASGYIVGGDDNPDTDDTSTTTTTAGGGSNDGVMNLEMALQQNEVNDTSCAIFEEGDDDDDDDDDKVGPVEEGQSKDDRPDDESQQFAKKPEVRMV